MNCLARFGAVIELAKAAVDNLLGTQLVDRVLDFNVVVVDRKIQAFRKRRCDHRSDGPGIRFLFAEVRIAARLRTETDVQVIERVDFRRQDALLDA